MSPYDVINPGIVRLLHSRLHRMLSSRLMTVSYRGNRTGRRYCVPVSYYREGDIVYCFTNGRWRVNFRAKRDAVLRLRGEDWAAIGRIEALPREERIDIMAAYFQAVPQDRKFYGVRSSAQGEPIRGQVAQATLVVDIIRFNLQ